MHVIRLREPWKRVQTDSLSFCRSFHQPTGLQQAQVFLRITLNENAPVALASVSLNDEILPNNDGELEPEGRSVFDIGHALQPFNRVELTFQAAPSSQRNCPHTLETIAQVAIEIVD